MTLRLCLSQKDCKNTSCYEALALSEVNLNSSFPNLKYSIVNIEDNCVRKCCDGNNSCFIVSSKTETVLPSIATTFSSSEVFYY